MDGLEEGSLIEKGRWQIMIDRGMQITVFSCPNCGKISRVGPVSVDGTARPSCRGCGQTDDVTLKGWAP